jgi:ADP-ribosylglycohydrolase
MNSSNYPSACTGCLLGQALGDSLGLPVEFLKPEKTRRYFRRGVEQTLFWGRGMVSDDTDNACFTAQSLIRCFDDCSKFKHNLAWRLRLWLLSLPAGIGFATLRSILKLWLGFSPEKSGVFSAGNGPAMRSPIIGVFFADDFARMSEFVKASTLLTHTDPKAFHGAMIVAFAASLSGKRQNVSFTAFKELINAQIPDMNEEFADLMARAIDSSEKNESLEDFILSEGWVNGVSGYIVHTVAAVIHVWLRNQKNFAGGIEEIILAGGDTDTTAAILGAIIGAGADSASFPETWVKKLAEWPRSVQWLEKLGDRLEEVKSTGKKGFPPYYAWYLIPLRNLVFIFIILLQVFKRILF